jgi:hypothetical protein
MGSRERENPWAATRAIASDQFAEPVIVQVPDRDTRATTHIGRHHNVREAIANEAGGFSGTGAVTANAIVAAVFPLSSSLATTRTL